MFDCFWSSVPVQLIAWKDLSPKWLNVNITKFRLKTTSDHSRLHNGHQCLQETTLNARLSGAYSGSQLRGEGIKRMAEGPRGSRPKKPRAGVGSWRGAASPYPPARGLRSAVSSPSGVRGGRQAVLLHLKYPGRPFLTLEWCYCYWRQEVTGMFLTVDKNRLS